MTVRAEIEDAILSVCSELARMRSSLASCERLLRENLERLARVEEEKTHE